MTSPIIRHIDRSTSVRPITMDDITIEGVLLSRYPDCPARDNVLAYCRQRHAGDLTLNTSTMTSLLSDLFYNKTSPGKRYIRRCPGVDITVRVADLPLELTDVVIDGKPLWMYPACKERDDVLQYCQTKVTDRTNLATSELDALKEALKNAAAQPQPTPSEQEQPDDEHLECLNMTVCRDGQPDIVVEFLQTNGELNFEDITLDGVKLSEYKPSMARQRLVHYLRKNKITAGQRVTSTQAKEIFDLITQARERTVMTSQTNTSQPQEQQASDKPDDAPDEQIDPDQVGWFIPVKISNAYDYLGVCVPSLNPTGTRVYLTVRVVPHITCDHVLINGRQLSEYPASSTREEMLAFCRHNAKEGQPFSLKPVSVLLEELKQTVQPSGTKPSPLTEYGPLDADNSEAAAITLKDYLKVPFVYSTPRNVFEFIPREGRTPKLKLNGKKFSGKQLGVFDVFGIENVIINMIARSSPETIEAVNKELDGMVESLEQAGVLRGKKTPISSLNILDQVITAVLNNTDATPDFSFSLTVHADVTEELSRLPKSVRKQLVTELQMNDGETRTTVTFRT